MPFNSCDPSYSFPNRSMLVITTALRPVSVPGGLVLVLFNNFTQCVWHGTHNTDGCLHCLSLPPWYRHSFNHAPDNSTYSTLLLPCQVGDLNNWCWHVWNVQPSGMQRSRAWCGTPS